MIQISGCQLIAGHESKEGADSFTSVNPQNRQIGDVLFSEATPAEIDRAVLAARSAFNETRNYVKRVFSYIPVFEHRMVGHDQVKPMPLEAIQTKKCSG